MTKAASKVRKTARKSGRELDDEQIAALPRPRTGWRFTKAGGVSHLFIGIGASGLRRWVWYAKVAGNPVRRVIGDWPAMAREDAGRKALDMARLRSHAPTPDEMTIEVRKTQTLDALFIEYLAGKRKRDGAFLSPSAKQIYRYWWNKHIALREAVDDPPRGLAAKPLNAVTRQTVGRLHLKIGKDTPASANRVVAVLSSVFAFAITEGYTTANPARGIRFFPEVKRTRWAGEQEMPALLAAIQMDQNHDARDALLLMLYCGQRKTATQRMRWENVNWQRQEFLVPKADSKSGSEYTVTLSKVALAILSARHADQATGWIFPSQRKPGKPLTTTDHAWKRVLARAGLRDMHQHDLRHTHASWLVSGGASLPTVAAALGHKTIRSTERYAHIAPSAVKSAVADATAAMVEAGKAKPKAEVVNIGAAKR